MLQTHEGYIAAIAQKAIAKLSSDEQAKLASIKLVYGAGDGGIRGVTYFNKWKKGEDTLAPFVEVSAFGQESEVQLAGTTIHELAHALAGWNAGHGPQWKAACERLGLRKAKAAGMRYSLAAFAPDIREAIASLPKPTDGQPVPLLGGLGIGPGLGLTGLPVSGPKPCKAGIGTKGGKSRGAGSGSRLRLWECQCEPPQKVRASTDRLRAHCDDCRGAFVLQCKAT